MKAPGRHLLNFSLFNKLCGCCSLQWSFADHLQRATLCPSIILCCSGNLYGTPLANKSTECTQVLLLGTLPSYKRLSGQTPYPITRSPHKDYPHSFRKISTVLGFYTAPKCPQIPDVSPRILSLPPISPPYLILPTLVPSCPQSTHKK